jgi:hypothetical protein
MKKSELNWKNGEVMGWDLDDLNLSESAESQIDRLKEDLALVRFGNTILLGLGWLPEFNPQGQFVLDVVKFENWEKPVLQLKFRDTAKLIEYLNQAIETADRLARQA